MSPTPVFSTLDTGKQERIFDAALDEFADHGFSGASVNRVVGRLGIAKGSIFQYFGTKLGLFEYVFERASGAFADNLRQVRDTTAGADVFSRLRASLEAGLAFIDAYPRLYRLYLKMLFDEGFPWRQRFLVEARRTAARYLRPLVETGLARGELRPDLDVTAAVFLLDAVLDRFLQAYAVPFMDAGSGLHQAPPDVLAARVDQLMDTLRRGLAASQGDCRGS